MNFKIKDRTITVSGVVHEQSTDAFMRFLCARHVTSKYITWEQVKKFSSSARRAWIDTRIWWDNLPVAENVVREILLTECTSVAILMFRERFSSQTTKVMNSLTLKEILRIIKRHSYRTNIDRLVGMINKMHLPVLATMEGLSNHVLDAVANRLSGKETDL